jgi:hypothetical protein
MHACEAAKLVTATLALYAGPIRLLLTDDTLEVRLARWESALGLLRTIRVPREDVSDVRVVEDPLREVMQAGIKVGLRLPWLLYIARTIGLDRAFIVRRGVPALSFAVQDQGRLKEVLVSTPNAHELASQLRTG